MAEKQAFVLIIDDRPEDIRGITELLLAEGIRINLATDAQQGYHRAQALQPDIILLDVRMPGADGFAACRILKADPQTRDIPVIFFSSASADKERLEGLLNGGVDYILKPCLPMEVLARVRIHLKLAARNMAPPAPAESPVSLHPDEVTLRAAMGFILANLADLPQLGEIAGKAGTHGKRLSAIFRERLGVTVFHWIREERLRRGRELLANSHLGMQDIAEQVGFRSACNFTTAFRERMGMTPTAYRSSMHVGDDDADD
ncbi:MAG: DNA-binding response regulator [Rhodanobacter sp. 68-29]|uniref:response regulator transcription factor n=1 Tax=Rhodanobacter sp. PCA2 TaxID=2006117 RepID=UPI00086CA19F|nr:DNA-binding response regulator [Rhodanobacter sp. PCA2]MBA2078349.1 DNA-binding response regulator [Rhodanobacter sp. PCA2]MBN8924075.1 DNA-binding response regulator [Rhodanobacter sp.]ODU74703.1 MAG: DNA-binding response regulator [Rhodanobacter sp. SCN 69-32]OJY58080.1 MAG: DNA-binding response regulator [Rhodanobacter sp. 68-29]